MSVERQTTKCVFEFTPYKQKNMVPNRDKWIRIFDIPDTSRHKQGFTIYKVISLLYPESCPDAVTRLTVWKRFNDFKKLHRDIKVLQRKLNIKSKVPNLASGSLFKRFDNDTIAERKESILLFLDYVAFHSQLFASNEFVKFFETSHTPVDQLNSNISAIRADLNLPEAAEYLTNANSDDDHTISDTDSITTLSSLSPSVQNLEATSDFHALPKLKKLDSIASITSQTSKNSDSASISTTTDSLLLIDGQIYPTPPQTPSSSAEYAQYIVDASVHINMAIELENDKKYEEAFLAYKTAIDILLKYGKDDTNYDRKQLVRYKTDKYLVRAEKIYNMYLAEEVKNLHQIADLPEVAPTKRPTYDLYKYKVMRIVGNGMLVLHSDSQQLFYVKVIHKAMQFLNDHLILPENVPYMVKLYNHFNCENALFLVLEYCSGTLLSEYIKRQRNDIDLTSSKNDEILKQIQDISDNESEASFSELVNEYTTSKYSQTNSSQSKTNQNEEELVSSDEYVKVDQDCFLPAHKKRPVNILDRPIVEKNLDDDLLTQSQRLFSSLGEPAAGNSAQEPNDLASIKPVEETVKWAAQLLVALEKLHVLGITCRDLQMKNLLIDDGGDLRLTYMCNVNELCDLYTNQVNINLAPEVYSYQTVTADADWWSFGAILYELLIGMPLCDVHPNGLTSYSHLKIPKYVSAEGRSLLKQLLSYEPNDRLGSGLNGVDYLKSHPFFSSITWDVLLKKYKH